MPLTNEQAVIQVQERLKGLQKLIHDIENERKKSEQTIVNINRTAKSNVQMQHKLKGLYKTGLLEAAKEEALLRQALKKITEIRDIRNERRIQARNAGNKVTFIRQGELMKMVHSLARTLPLFISKPGEKVPPLCGCIPADVNYCCKAGDMVAALVKLGSEKESDYILAEVVQYIHNSGKYEVSDIDAELKTKSKYKHVLSKRNIIPLPLFRANPATDGHALYPKNTIVFALYPQTTVFYKGVISQLPETANDDYQVLFDDNSYKSGYSPPYKVSQRYVFSVKQSKKNTGS